MEASKPENTIPAAEVGKSKFLATSIHESALWRICSRVAVDVSDCSPTKNRSVAFIVTNAEIASIFDHVADLLEYQGSNIFRVRAYRNAARLVLGIVEPLTAIREANDRSFLDFDGIGKDLAEKLETLLDSGQLPMLKQLEEEVPNVVFDLMRVPGLGPKKVKLLMTALQLESLEDLEAACQEGKVSLLKGFGKKTEQAILSNIAFAQNPDNSRVLWDEADQIISLLIQWMKKSDSVHRIEAAGSWRRGKETVGDLDLLVESDQAKEVMDHFLAWEHTDHVIVQGDSKTSIRGPHGIQVDMRVVEKQSFGAAWQYFTGSKEHNVKLRSRAKKLGFSINEYGVTELNKTDGKILAGKSEKDVYAAVGLEWIPPELREDRGEFELSEKAELPKLITLADIRGDLISDLNYNVTYGGDSFIPFPSQISSIEQSSDGKINELSLTVFNVDNIISAIIEDPFLVGNNISNACQAFVNGELVTEGEKVVIGGDNYKVYCRRHFSKITGLI